MGNALRNLQFENNSIDLDEAKRGFEKTMLLFKDIEKLKELETKSDNEGNVKRLKEKILRQCEEVFEYDYDNYHDYYENKFLTSALLFLLIKGEGFEFFKQKLEENYGKKLCVVNVFGDFRECGINDGELIHEYKQQYNATLLVPEMTAELLKRKHYRISNENIEKISKLEDVFMLNDYWYIPEKYMTDKVVYLKNKDYNKRKGNEIEIKNIFNCVNLFSVGSTEELIDVLKNADISNDLFFKNDKRYISAVWDTVEFENEKIKISDSEKNKQKIRDAKRYLDELEKGV